MHSVNLDLDKITFVNDDQSSNEFSQIKSFADSEMIRIYFKRKLLRGNGKLGIHFQGIYPDDESLYKTQCLNRNGEIKYGVCTQFEVSYDFRIVLKGNHFLYVI